MKEGVVLLRVEKAPTDFEWDSRARHAVARMPVFFPRWKTIAADIRACSTELYWVRSRSVAARAKLTSVLDEVLQDPLSAVNFEKSWLPKKTRPGFQWWCLEKSYRPGVTDNAGQVLAEAIGLVGAIEAECRTGLRLWLALPTNIERVDVEAYGNEVFYNSLIEKMELSTSGEALRRDGDLFAKPAWIELRGEVTPNLAADVSQTGAAFERFDFAKMSVDEMERLSAERLWALSRQELEVVRRHFEKLGRAATDVEIEVIAQTWSEHCKHKIFAADIEVKSARDDLELPKHIESVFKTYIKGATSKIPAPFLKSVFSDNAGVINITPKLDCAIKVETHNSPSALDPYGGSLTGIVGVNRDILGVGLGAQPIANLDVFCVGPIDAQEPLPPRLHHPRRILEGIRTGVEHGGNKSGIPTVTGAVVHHEGFLGKPLVFCGTVGLIPTEKNYIDKAIEPGDRIVMVGGRVGKDGIHGATFSSLEMNEDSPVSAVQLGDPLTQRRVWDFLIEARDQGLFRAVTDNGAGGLSSSIGELATLCGKHGGARLDVGCARTKYPGLRPYELVVSESQERMSFAVPPDKLKSFIDLAVRRGVECSDLGTFEDSGRFTILYSGEIVGDLELEFLHDGLPKMSLKACVEIPRMPNEVIRYGAWNDAVARSGAETLEAALPAVLAAPNVASRRPIVRQYDHEVQARSVRKPYGTPRHVAPNDGATLRLSRESFEGIALGLGLAPHAAMIDPKVATELAIDEALRNAVVAGMDPSHAAFVDNFCWPDPLPSSSNPDAEEKLGALVVTCKRAYEGAIELGIPFISGKDSMKNDYRMGSVKISVPPTLLMTTMGKVHDVRTVPRGYVVGEGRKILWVSGQDIAPNPLGLPKVDFELAKQFLSAMHGLICQGKIESVHDVSDGGWLVATAEMLLGTGLGATLDVGAAELGRWEEGAAARQEGPVTDLDWTFLFGEPATSFVLSVRDEHALLVGRTLQECGSVFTVGRSVSHPKLTVTIDRAATAAWDVVELERAYHGQMAGGAR